MIASRISVRCLLSVIALAAWTFATLAAAAPTPSPAPHSATKTTTPSTTKTTTSKTTTTGKSTTGKPPTKAPAKAQSAESKMRAVADAARQARELEDAGAYGQTVDALRALRAKVKPDADLELALALDEARVGRIDSARTRLLRPLMQAAVLETLPLTRRREYPYQREFGWLDGRFDGWSWYIWRARAELAAETGHWDEAYAAAQHCVSERPLSGKEWLILAVCAGRIGKDEEAHAAARQALDLDPTLPETRYLVGLWEWRAGRRGEASTQFREAVALDSAFVPAALGLMRTKLPGAQPDTLPARFLTGRRRVALLTAPERPKPEEFVQVDQSALIMTSPDTAIVDSIPPGTKPKQLVLSVLVDERGRAVVNEIPWFPQGAIPTWKIHRLLASVPSWEFQPAVRLGSPLPIWVNVDFYFSP